jgi:DNA-binding HxlR family transcriptional regulator
VGAVARYNSPVDTERSVYADPWVEPGQEVLHRVAEKWASLVICSLRRGPKRHAELRRSLDGVSQRMLTLTLRRLEESGLVSRRVVKAAPPQVVEYALTPLGESLVGPLEGVLKWAERHHDELAGAPDPSVPAGPSALEQQDRAGA